MKNQGKEKPFNRLAAIDRTTELWAMRRLKNLSAAEREEFQTLHEGLLEDNRAAMWRQKAALEIPTRQEGGIH